MRERLRLDEPVPLALDVACGTGLSTIALKPVAREIVGTDISLEMIRLAPADPQIRYVVAPAEDLPFPDGTFDLLTLCAALHWLDPAAFFPEAHRVLRRGGFMVIYDHAFTGSMAENPAFHTWMRRVFLTAYPMPPHPRPPMPGAAEEAGFRSLGEEEYRHTARFSIERLIDYLVSRSNVIAAVEGKGQPIEEVRGWLTERITPFFAGEEERNFVFGGPIWYFGNE
jgi:SAM-dependent methyltransferase